MAGSLVSVILHHFLEALFAALRKFRIVSTMQFCQSMVFALISLSLLWWWRLSAASIVIGYGAACLVSSATVLLCTGRSIAEVAAAGPDVAHREFWPPLVRFADLGLVHQPALQSVRGGRPLHARALERPERRRALTQVGYYHSSRVVPLLLISLADLLAGIVMPYLSHDWERGERRLVSDRLNLVLKLTALGMLAASVLILLGAPLLFRVAFEGRYNVGPDRAAVDAHLLRVVRDADRRPELHLVCREDEARLAAAGHRLGGEHRLNMLLLPIWGLFGAVLATTHLDRPGARPAVWAQSPRGHVVRQAGLVWLPIAPLALGGGVWLAAAVLAAILLAAPFSRTLLTDEERAMLGGFILREQLLIGIHSLTTEASGY